MKTCDIVLIGVGGQGVVTLGDLIARAAMAADIPISYVPTKGMAQRGGFVKVEIRLGREDAGPRVPEHGANLVVSMERSEALKGLHSVRPDGRFILYDHVWEPTGVMLGEEGYPSQDAVSSTLSHAVKDVLILHPDDRPLFEDRIVEANVFTLGAMFGTPALCELINPETMNAVLQRRWPKAAEANDCAFRAGLTRARSTQRGTPPAGGLPKGGDDVND